MGRGKKLEVAMLWYVWILHDGMHQILFSLHAVPLLSLRSETATSCSWKLLLVCFYNFVSHLGHILRPADAKGAGSKANTTW